ncbi:MAG: MaoC family dehydratase N-terminal domain-containing protein [Azonexus sp.]|jgi:acyl dehydratase|nr:MaoC family dehydratase N-terminal domain-containing protein [Azonexus sp.]
MALDYQTLKNWPFGPVEQTWSQRDTMLYALALGCGADSGNADNLRFVYEEGLRALPTMATVLGYPGFWMMQEASGIDWRRVVNGEQRLILHRPLPTAGRFIGRSRVTHITDKGKVGALVVTARELSNAVTGDLLATVQTVTVCRGDGGYSATGQPSDEPLPPLPGPPADRSPDDVIDLPTRPETALIYRLVGGDMNPLHADPRSAAAAGFERPILHGLASFGLVGRAVLAVCCGGDPTRLTALAARYSAPVFPGETLRTEIWRIGQQAHFRASIPARNALVLSHGLARCAAA